MSLFVRVNTNFYSHRKTLRLRAALGNDAFWVPPRLWAYAAEHNPDGNLSSYSANELAMSVSFCGDAQAMLEAMLQAGFLDPDPLRIHDWDEHQCFHVSRAAFTERAKKAAAARWSKERTKEKEEIESRGDESRGEGSIAPSIASSINGDHGMPATADEAVRMCMASGVPEAFIRDIFQQADSRGFKDGAGVAITKWPSYVKRRHNKELSEPKKNHSHYGNQRVQRTKPDYSSGKF